MLTNGVQSIFRQLPHIRSAAMKPFNSNVVAIVIGTTGSGKTKLGVELASKFGGEVINADSIQMYKGLDVASAKVTDEEMCGVRHHLLSFLPPTREYTVREFERDATALIEDIHSRNKVPVIVGGTMYYVQSLLRPSTLQSVEVRRSGPEVDAALAELAALPDEALHDRLLEVDPMMAERLHVNDQRKLRRALESYYQTGLPHSELLRIQAEGVRAETSKFRFAIFWLQTNQQVLDKRLDDRVDKMVAQGLIDEIRAFRDALRYADDTETAAAEASTSSAAAPLATDSTAARLGGDGVPLRRDGPPGLLQAIGFKEFEEYLRLQEAHAGHGSAVETDTNSSTGRDAADVEAALQHSLDKLKQVTRKYARAQAKWIRNRFAKRGVSMLRLDTSRVELWDEKVRIPALDYLGGALDGTLPDTELLIPAETDFDKIKAWRKFHCDTCDRSFNGQHEYEHHMNSKQHRRQIAAVAKRGAYELWKAKQTSKSDRTDEPTAATKPRSETDALEDSGDAKRVKR